VRGPKAVVAAFLLLVALSAGCSKHDSSKAAPPLKLDAKGCTEMKGALTTLARVPSGAVPTAEADAAILVLRGHAQDRPETSTLSLGVYALATASSKEKKATVASTIADGFRASVTSLQKAVEQACTGK
jgi:hypothetical protein